ASTWAKPNDAAAFDAVMSPPPDPRDIYLVWSQADDAGRIVQLKQGFETDQDGAAELDFAVAVYTAREQAARALERPYVLDYVPPGWKEGKVDLPKLGDESSGYTVDGVRNQDAGPQRWLLYSWRHDRVVFTVTALGTREVADGARQAAIDLAN